MIDALMFVHIAAGLGALTVGPAAMLARPKGGARHRLYGRLYMALMGVLAATAGLLLTVRWNPFFFALSVFSFYLAFSGWRVLGRKKPWDGERARPVDWAAAVAVLGTAGVSVRLRQTGVFGDDAAVVLGTLGFAVLAAVYDLYRFATPTRRDRLRAVWLLEHLTKSVGSYLAVASAFSGTVLSEYLPVGWAQTWPAIVGVPPLLWVANRYWRRMRPGTSAAAMAGTRAPSTHDPGPTAPDTPS